MSIENQNMDLNELLSTMKFIHDKEAEDVDCTALRDFIKGKSKRIDLDYDKEYQPDEEKILG
jgi:hypothetical protein